MNPSINQLVINEELREWAIPLTRMKLEALAEQVRQEGKFTNKVCYCEFEGELVVLDGMNRVTMIRDNMVPGIEPPDLELISFDNPDFDTLKAWISQYTLSQRNASVESQIVHAAFLAEIEMKGGKTDAIRRIAKAYNISNSGLREAIFWNRGLATLRKLHESEEPGMIEAISIGRGFISRKGLISIGKFDEEDKRENEANRLWDEAIGESKEIRHEAPAFDPNDVMEDTEEEVTILGRAEDARRTDEDDEEKQIEAVTSSAPSIKIDDEENPVAVGSQAIAAFTTMVDLLTKFSRLSSFNIDPHNSGLEKLYQAVKNEVVVQQKYQTEAEKLAK